MKEETSFMKEEISFMKEETSFMKEETSFMKNAGDCHFRTKKGIIAGAETVTKRPFSHRFNNEKEKNMNNDVFSASEAVFLSFANAFNAGTVYHAALLGIPAALVTGNTAKLAAFTAACHAAGAPNAGSIDRADRKEKRKDLTKNIRKIKNAYLDADPLDAVTPEILLDFGLRPKDHVRTGVPDPAEAVPFTLEAGEYLQIIVKHPARPPRCIGAVALFKVGGPVPKTHKELTSSKLLTRLREILFFEDTQLGETLYIALCWQNEKGKLGPPSPIQSRVIS
jgi:hypothetical protein